MSRTMRRSLPLVAVAALVAVWFLWFRPAYLGGPVSYVLVSGVSMEPTLHDGDLALVRTRDSYARGDVVAYRLPSGEPAAGGLVIHRIVGGSGPTGFVMRGDNKDDPDPWRPTEGDVLGSFWLRISGGGRVVDWIRDPFLFGGLLAALAVFTVLVGEDKKHEVGSATVASPAWVPPSRMQDTWTLAEFRTRGGVHAAAHGRRGRT